jgi:hypothetical protein
MTTARYRAAAAAILGVLIAATPSQMANSQLMTTFVGSPAGGAPLTPCGAGQLDFSVAGCNIMWMGG